jgi:predicted metal-dependent phosphotriesterase family hydrolase
MRGFVLKDHDSATFHRAFYLKRQFPGLEPIGAIHLDLDEVRLLQDAAIDAGVQRFLVTHVNRALCKKDLNLQRELIGKGAYLEYVAISCVSATFYEQTPHELAGWIMETNGDHIILSSDLGQGSGPPHPEGIRMLLCSLLVEGVAAEYLEKMTKANPAYLTGLRP